jgi:hypothetical protein
MKKLTKKRIWKTKQIILSVAYSVFLAINPLSSTTLQGQSDSKDTAAIPGEHENEATPNQSSTPGTAPDTHRGMAKPKLLLPDGFNIKWLGAKLVKHPEDQRWFLKFDKNSQNKPNATKEKSDETPARPRAGKTTRQIEKTDPFDVPIEILPCRQLAIMTRIGQSQSNKQLAFQVNAEVTTYRNRNYVLPLKVHTLSLFGNQPASENQTQTASPLDQMSSSSSNESGSATPSVPESDPNEKGEPQDTLRETLMKIRRPLPLDRTDAAKEIDAAESGEKKNYLIGGASRSDLREDTMIVDRVGRLAYNPETRQWLFDFEADGAGLTEPPVALHPNQLLEKMEELSNQEARALKFRVSGQISKFQHSNYMLLRKMFIVTDGGNLGK